MALLKMSSSKIVSFSSRILVVILLLSIIFQTSGATGEGGDQITDLSTQEQNFVQNANVEVISVVSSSNYAYVGTYDKIFVVDISTPHNLEIKNTISSAAEGLQIHSGYLFASTYSNIKIYDLTDPASPNLVATITEYIVKSSVFTVYDNTLVLMATKEAGIQILKSYDISDISAPTFKGSYTYNYDINAGYSGIWGVAYSGGDYVYLMGGAKGLVVVNLNNYTLSTVIQFYTNEYGRAGGRAIATFNNYLYLLSIDGGLFVYDIVDPATPSYIATVPTKAAFLSIGENYAFICAVNTNIQMINIHTPASPSVVGSYSATQYIHGIASSNGVLLVISATGETVEWVSYETTGMQYQDTIIIPDNLSSKETDTSTSNNSATDTTVETNATGPTVTKGDEVTDLRGLSFSVVFIVAIPVVIILRENDK